MSGVLRFVKVEKCAILEVFVVFPLLICGLNNSFQKS